MRGAAPDWPCQTGGLARIGDPITSLLAADTIRRDGTQKDQQALALSFVQQWPGKTSCELALYQEDLDRYQLARRLPELERCGAIVRGKPRRSDATQRKALTWHPVKPEPKELTLF